MIEISCLKCKNCDFENDSCLVYGADANKSVEECAEDNFKNYQKITDRIGLSWQK